MSQRPRVLIELGVELDRAARDAGRRRRIRLPAARLPSFSGVVTFKNAADVREAAALCPMDRLLVETDAPFLTPVPHRGTLNEPSRVPLVGAAFAQVKGVATSVEAEGTTRNALALFSL